MQPWLEIYPTSTTFSGALEVPRLPLLPFFIVDNRILQPMRWGVAGTMAATTEALKGHNTWNMSGGYHHASFGAAEGFCIYNDIGITLKELLRQNLINESDKILIVDIDAHHGNGNALTFMQNKNVSLLDIYNHDVYPSTQYTKDRLDVNIPLRFGTEGDEYLTKLENGLNRLAGDYKVAFVVAGTDVLVSDPLGGLKLSLDECVIRDRMVLEKLISLSIPAVFLGGGGYSKDSATAITRSLSGLYQL